MRNSGDPTGPRNRIFPPPCRYGAKFFEYLNRDKGYARQLTEIWKVEFPDGLESIADFPNLTAAMQRAGWSETKIRRVMGENWVALLDRVWTV